MADMKKPNIFVRLGQKIKKFWKEYISELKKVTWMSASDVKKNCVLVFSSIIVFSVAIALVDTCLSEIVEGLARLVG